MAYYVAVKNQNSNTTKTWNVKIQVSPNVKQTNDVQKEVKIQRLR